MTSRSRLRSVQVERCAQVFYNEPVLRNGLYVESNQNGMIKSTNSTRGFESALIHSTVSGSVIGGCCCPTTSTAPSPTSAATTSSIVTVVSEPKSRGIVHSITENGVARLVFEENFTRLKGVLLNQYEESISITGTSAASDSRADPLEALERALQAEREARSQPDIKNHDGVTSITRRTMTITVVDGEAGQTFCVENVELEIVATAPGSGMPTTGDCCAPTQAQPQLCVSINHPAIRFQTEDVFIGNKAEIEIRKYLGGWGGVAIGRLSRMHSRSAPHNHYGAHSSHASPSRCANGNGGGANSTTGSSTPLALYLGRMALNVVSMERTAQSMRRVSTCDACATNIIEQANDFLV